MVEKFIPRKYLKQYRTFRRVVWDEKLTMREWNAGLNIGADELMIQAKKSNYDLGIDNHDTEMRWAASLYRGMHGLVAGFIIEAANLSGGRKQNIDLSELAKPSNINIWANRYADQLRESTLRVQRFNRSINETAETSSRHVRSFLRIGAMEIGALSGAVMGLTITSEMLAHGVAKSTGGRKPYIYSIRPTFATREDAGNHKEDPKHSYAAFMQRKANYQRPSELKLSAAFR